MKIDSSIKPAVTPATTGAKPKPAATNAGSAAEVRLSALAGQMQSGDAQPPVNAAKVAEIRQAIADGRFTIDAGAIADSLISTAQELVAAQRKA